MKKPERTDKELIVLEDGREVWQYSDGLQRDAETGLIVRPAEKHIIRDAERSNELRKRYREKYLEAVDTGLAAASPNQSPVDTVHRIVKKRAEVAMSDEGRPGNEAARIIFQLTGLYSDRKTAAQPGIELKMSAQVAGEVLAAIIEEKNRRSQVE